VTRAVRMTFPRGAPKSGNIASGSTTFGADGTLSGSSYSGPANWFYPPAGGVGGQYYLNIQRTSGTGGVTFGVYSDTTWTQLSSNQTISAVGAAGSCAGNWKIASGSIVGPIVASGTISVNNTI
jgi:hypothetical protein